MAIRDAKEIRRRLREVLYTEFIEKKKSKVFKNDLPGAIPAERPDTARELKVLIRNGIIEDCNGYVTLTQRGKDDLTREFVPYLIPDFYRRSPRGVKEKKELINRIYKRIGEIDDGSRESNLGEKKIEQLKYEIESRTSGIRSWVAIGISLFALAASVII